MGSGGVPASARGRDARATPRMGSLEIESVAPNHNVEGLLRPDLLDDHHGDVVAAAGELGRLDQVAAGRGEFVVLEQDLADLVVVEHLGDAVRAEQQAFAAVPLEGLHVGRALAAHADEARDCPLRGW